MTDNSPHTQDPNNGNGSTLSRRSTGRNSQRGPLHTLLDYVPVDQMKNNETGQSQSQPQPQPQPPILPIRPKRPFRCPLLGCFYSEFDIKTGPVIRCQSPPFIMDQDIHVPMSQMERLLQTTFEDLEARGEAVGVEIPRCNGGVGDERHDEHHDGHDYYHDNGDDDNKNNYDIGEIQEDTTSPPGEYESDNEDSDGRSATAPDDDSSGLPSLATRNPTPQTIAPPEGGLSIFDSTSEFIITGTELTSKIITLSAHSWHVMTRPTIISNSRYERNTLLFSVGFLLRRAADPSPFRPLLSKLAVTLQAMEEESGFLTKQAHRPRLQILLERVLLSLNSSEYECNLLLSPSNALHLKLYHPPKPETALVHDYQVPILLRRDLQLQMVCCVL
jgi:Nitrogen permease regulator 2